MVEKDRKEWDWGIIGVEEQRHHMLAENLKMTPEDRLRQVQELRETFYGNETALPRFQRLSDHSESGEGPLYGCRRLGRRVARLAEDDEGY